MIRRLASSMLVVGLMLGQTGARAPVAHSFAQKGYPELVLVWYSGEPGELRIFTVRNGAGQEKVEYSFNPLGQPRKGYGGLYYHVIPVPEGFGATEVEIETYVFKEKRKLEVQ